MTTIGNYTPDNLISGDMNIATKSIIIPQGNVINRGDVLGKLNASVPTTGTAGGGNTGDGTMTAVSGRREILPGVYTFTCTAAATDSGTFSVTNPKGDNLPEVTVGVAFENDEIAGIINDGTADFVVDDSFTVTVAVALFECVLVNSAGTDDGRRTVYCIASEDIDASASGENKDVTSTGYLTGQYNVRSLVFGGTDTAETHEEQMREIGLFINFSVER